MAKSKQFGILILGFCWGLGFGILSLCGCGYTIGNAYEIKSVDIPVFENNSIRRINEFELTEVVTRHLQAQGVRVNNSSEYILVGEILDYDSPSIFTSKLDDPIVNAVSVKVRVKLKNKSTGAVIWEDIKGENADMIFTRGETEETARTEVYDKLARWVAMKLEKW